MLVQRNRKGFDKFGHAVCCPCRCRERPRPLASARSLVSVRYGRRTGLILGVLALGRPLPALEFAASPERICGRDGPPGAARFEARGTRQGGSQGRHEVVWRKLLLLSSAPADHDLIGPSQI